MNLKNVSSSVNIIIVIVYMPFAIIGTEIRSYSLKFEIESK